MNIVQTLDTLSYLVRPLFQLQRRYSVKPRLHLWEHSVSLPVDFRPLTLSATSAVYQPGLGRLLNFCGFRIKDASPGSWRLGCYS